MERLARVLVGTAGGPSTIEACGHAGAVGQGGGEVTAVASEGGRLVSWDLVASGLTASPQRHCLALP